MYKLLVLLVCLVVLGPGLATVAAAQDDAETTTARERFQEGVRYFDQNEFGKARIAFMQAYALKKHPDVLLNLGLSELRTPGYEVDAAIHLTEYLRQATDSDKQEQAEEALEEAREKILTVNVEVDVTVTQVLVDDEPYTVGPVPGPIFLEAGAHTIEVHVADDAKSNDVTGDVGDERTIEFVFASDSDATAVATGPVEEPASEKKKGKKEKKAKEAAPASERTADGRMPFFKWFAKRPLAIVLGAVGVGGVGGGVGLLLAAQNEYDNADVLEAGILARAELDAANMNDDYAAFRAAYATQAPCGSDGVPPLAVNPSDTRYVDWCREYYDTTARGDDFLTISLISFGVGGAALIAVPVYYFLDSKPKKGSARSLREPHETELFGRRSVRIAPVVGTNFSGLSINGHF